MQGVQTEVANALLKNITDEAAVATGVVAVAMDDDGDADGPPGGGGATRGSRAHEIEAPMFAITTPYAVVERQLLRYDRDTHLLPSVFTYANQVWESLARSCSLN